jgi:chaperonin GroES
MKIRPLQGHVLVYMDPPENQSGDIHIPETAQSRSQVGQVRTLGIWRQNRAGNLVPYPFKAGDRVVVNARSGRWLHSERERLKLVPMEKVLAVFEQELSPDSINGNAPEGRL